MNIQVSIGLPHDLLLRIDDLAATESRSRSNMITLLLEVAMGRSPEQILDEAGRSATRSIARAQEQALLADMRTDTNSPEIDETPAHEHRKATVIAGGLHRCNCGSIRAQDGTWS